MWQFVLGAFVFSMGVLFGSSITHSSFNKVFKEGSNNDEY